MASFTSVAAFQSQLLRKALVGAVLVADYSVDALTDIATTGGVLTVASGYKSLGKLTSDGLALSGTVEKSEIRGWGDTSSPSRIDVTSSSSSMTVTAMETKKAVWDAFYGVDMTSISADGTTGTIKFDKPAIPALRDKRVLFLARDVNKATGLDIYYGVHYPKANISQNGDQTFANTDATISYPLTIDSLVDDTAGTAVRLFLGGPGVDSTLVTAMGF